MADLAARRAQPAEQPAGAAVERHDVDDPRAWAELVQLLADLLYPAAPARSQEK